MCFQSFCVSSAIHFCYCCHTSLSLSCSTFCMYVLHHYSSIVMLQEISRIRAAADFHLILKTHGVPNHILVAEMTCAAPK